jgi:hypothetical protein
MLAQGRDKAFKASHKFVATIYLRVYESGYLHANKQVCLAHLE